MASLARLEIWCSYPSFKRWRGFGFRRYGDGNNGSSNGPGRGSARVISFCTHSKPKRTHEASTLAKEEGCCLWGIQHLEERLSQSQLILEVLNNAVAFTGG